MFKEISLCMIQDTNLGCEVTYKHGEGSRTKVPVAVGIRYNEEGCEKQNNEGIHKYDSL